MKNILLMLFAVCVSNAFSQTLEGTIYDKNTEMPLQAATVYLDGTTIATVTDAQGYFKIDSRGNTKSDLVISYVGYLTARIQNPFQNKKIKAFLEQDAIPIEEVLISKGPFTRKDMMKAFKEQFLGTSEAGLSCEIENEDDINLYYDIDTNTLSASSRRPIKIKNPYLGYEIFFELADFNVAYRRRSLFSSNIEKSYFSGTTFYKDISKSSKKVAKKRMEAYLGSAPHLMNTIASENWKEHKTTLFVDKFMADPKMYFQVSDTLGMKKVTLIKEPVKRVPIYDSKFEISGYKDEAANFNILYNGEKQSVMQFSEKVFIVDSSGNYSPIYGVMFGGYIGSLKAGDMLPTDYYQTVKDSR
ncbi:MAG TPA: carboxypeptidase-like regulatory domain-containing protein [Flavobacterium sp.]|nr:carboxypeptidase-like regulatory domain-containing protein [Flavobacterium sp.]